VQEGGGGVVHAMIDVPQTASLYKYTIYSISVHTIKDIYIQYKLYNT